jgi:hypothetical protein
MSSIRDKEKSSFMKMREFEILFFTHILGIN